MNTTHAHFATHHPLTRQAGVSFRTFSYGGLDDGIQDFYLCHRSEDGACQHVAADDETHQPGMRRTADEQVAGAVSEQAVPDYALQQSPPPTDSGAAYALDTDWPPAPYHAPQPEPLDTDWPCGVYIAPEPVIIEPFPVGQRVYATGCGRGVVIGTWRDWYQVRLEVNCGVVGLRVDRLRIA